MVKDENWPGWRAPFSAVAGIGWLIFIIIWLAFYASDYSFEKNVAIFFLSILVIFLLLGGVWSIWSLKMIPKKGWELLKFKGFKWRLIVSIILPFASMIFIIVWFWFYAEPYTIWQHIAVILVIFLVLATILSVVWIGWGKKYGEEFGRQAEEIGKEIDKKI
jgi:hypothetical protein